MPAVMNTEPLCHLKNRSNLATISLLQEITYDTNYTAHIPIIRLVLDAEQLI